MRKIVIQLLIFFYSIHSYSVHKPQVFVNKYGNVKTLTQTGFYGYGSTEKVRIAGKLAQILSERLSFKDTIVIEFRNDDTHVYPKTIIVENGNSSADYLISGGLEYIKEKQEKSYLLEYGQNAICIRRVDIDFNIEETLKLIEYCIFNKLRIELNLLKYNDPNWLPEVKPIDIEYYGLKKEFINKILKEPNSTLLNETLMNEVQFFNFESVNGFYANGIFTFKASELNYETKGLLFLLILNKGVCIFPSNDYFVYLSDKTTEIKMNKIFIEGYYPYLKNTLNIFQDMKRLEDGNLMLYKFNSGKGFVFSEEKNEIIKKIN